MGTAPDGGTYVYDGFTTRELTSEPGPEIQKITQDWYAEAVIYAMQIASNLLCNPIGVGDGEEKIFSRLIDINVDGRAWAVV